MTVIQMRAHARKASVARVEQMQKAEVARLTNEAEAKARCDENDSQRRIHMRGLEHVIRAAWVSPAMGPLHTKKAIAHIEELLAAKDLERPLTQTLRDSLEIVTNTAGKE